MAFSDTYRHNEVEGRGMKTNGKYFPMYKVIGIELLILIISYLIVRYPLFRLHGSYDAPKLALLPAVIGVMATVIIRWPFSFEGTSFGYLLSFAISQIFRKEYIDPARGDALYSNWFEIWMITYSAIVIICIVLDIVMSSRDKRRNG